jgi:hypothetical protein
LTADSVVELVTFAYGLTNVVRVLAYMPQIRCLWGTRGAAAGVSPGTWWMFCASHSTAALYMGLVARETLPAALFVANALCSGVIAGLATSRARYAG